jgi:hypothetical protein
MECELKWPLKIGEHLSSSKICLRGGEVPWQQFVDAHDRLIGDIFQHMLQLAFSAMSLSCVVPISE